MRVPFDARSARDRPPANTHRHGLLLTTVGVLVIVPDATLIRLIDADSLTTTLFRSGLTAVTLTTVLALWYRRRLFAVVRSSGRLGVLAAGLSAATTTFFVFSVDRTSVGNAVMLIATAPLWAAVWTRLTLGERIARRTLAALPVAFVGIAVAVSGSVGQGRLEGDLFALAAAIVLAANLTVLRHKHDVDMVPTAAMGNGLAAVVALALGSSTTLRADDVVPMLVLGIVVIPTALVLITAGARRLPSPETALIMLLETALSPVFAWLVVDEDLEPATLVGGAIVVATLVAHTVAGRVRSPRPAPLAGDPVREE